MNAYFLNELVIRGANHSKRRQEPAIPKQSLPNVRRRGSIDKELGLFKDIRDPPNIRWIVLWFRVVGIGGRQFWVVETVKTAMAVLDEVKFEVSEPAIESPAFL